MTKAILQQALDALEWASNLTQAAVDYRPLQNTIAALREAIAAPMPEPVAIADGTFNCNAPLGTPLYAAPPAAPAPAVPEGDVVVSWNEDGQIVAVTRQDREGRILSVIAESAAPVVPLTDERLQKHAMRAGDCPPGSMVVLLSSLRRMLSAAPVVREPLTREQIAKALASAGLKPEDYRKDGLIEPLVWAIEQAHGIGGGNG